MMSLKHMSVRSRLLLVLALPTLGLLAAAITLSVEKSGMARAMDRLEALVGVSVKIGEVVHTLQKERGMSAGFLGSEGRQFAGELPVQRKEVDGRIATLKETLRGFDGAHYDVVLGNALDEALRQLDGLPAKRDAIGALRIKVAEEIEYYTKTIDVLLAIPRYASLLSDDSSVARRAVAYANLLSAKERAGIERATLTSAFAAGRFTPEIFAHYLTNASAQEVYLNQFLASASPEQREFFQARHSGPIVEETMRLKKLAQERGDGRKLAGADPQHWFRTATARIDLLKEVENSLAANLGTAAESMRSGARTTLYLTMALAAAALAAVGVLGFLLARSIAQPLNQAVKVAEAIASGDLSGQIQVHSDNELGKLLSALAAMQHKLADVASNIRGSADQVSSAAQEIAGGNTDLSQRTQEQAAALEETASSMEELTATVKQNADNARQANRLAGSAREKANDGGKVVAETVDAMEAIRESSKKIADIVGVIDEIAFQTNLLALNAAVEAARAGESGRGFAVVAAEVRNLAQRSAQAAKEIKELIADSGGKVKTGVKLVTLSGQTLDDIVQAVKKVSDIIAEIAAASQEQASGIEQVNKAVTQMDEVTQQNAALVEEAAAAAKSMEEQALHLADTVAFFKNNGRPAQAKAGAIEAAPVAPKPGKSDSHAEPLRTRPRRIRVVRPAVAAPMKQAVGAGQEWENF